MTGDIDQAAAELLALSDERDQWERLWQASAREAYRRGYSAGRDDGYRDGYDQAVTDWKVVAGVPIGGPAFAELDRRRYPPDGRLSWIIQPQDDSKKRDVA